jgi:two-component system OmpR family response regulator
MKVLGFLTRSALQRRIAQALRTPSFVVETVAYAKDCLRLAHSTPYHAVLVDADDLKFGDVLTLVKLLREVNSVASLFVFSRYFDLEQRLGLFDAGADDCVGEPFFASELAVRLSLSIRLHQAASNLASPNTVDLLHSGDFELDLRRQKVARSGKLINLRPKEFLLLQYLVRNVNRPVTRTMILEHVWNSSFDGLTNVVDVYISALRRKVDRGFSQKLIHTNRGIGYTFTFPDGVFSTLDVCADSSAQRFRAQPSSSALHSDDADPDCHLCPN